MLNCKITYVSQFIPRHHDFFFPGIEDLYDSPTIHLVGGIERGSEYSKKD